MTALPEPEGIDISITAVKVNGFCALVLWQKNELNTAKIIM